MPMTTVRRSGATIRASTDMTMVKDVPANATAIGIPARVVEAQESNGRFTAYAVGRDENDPLARTMNEIISHSSDTDKRIDDMLAELAQLRALVGERNLPKP